MRPTNDNEPRKRKSIPRLKLTAIGSGTRKLLTKRPVRRAGDTSIYVIAQSAGTICKIGISAKPNARLNELQVGNPRVLSLVYTYDKLDRWTACSIERLTHQALDDFRLMGEWFAVEAEVAIRAIKDELGRHGISCATVEKKEEGPLLPAVEWAL